jgi:hypothetical protein
MRFKSEEPSRRTFSCFCHALKYFVSFNPPIVTCLNPCAVHTGNSGALTGTDRFGKRHQGNSYPAFQLCKAIAGYKTGKITPGTGLYINEAVMFEIAKTPKMKTWQDRYNLAAGQPCRAIAPPVRHSLRELSF